ncbi:MAG: WG repeat-containing protein [bacterium]
MANQQILDYLNQYKNQFSQEALVSELKKAGHSDNEIKEAINLAYNHKSRFFLKSKFKKISIFIFLIILLSWGLMKIKEEIDVRNNLAIKDEEFLPMRFGGLFSKYGYINKEGKILIKPKFFYVENFSDGLAKVMINDSLPFGFFPRGIKTGYINKKGKFVIKPTLREGSFECPGNFHEGVVRICIRDKVGYMNRRGEFITKPIFDDGFDFFEGIGRVRIGDKKGFINTEGKYIVEPKFGSATDFSEGLAAVCLEGEKNYEHRCGFIDKTGKFVIGSQLFISIPLSFSEGLAAVETKNGWGFIDRTGKFVIEPGFKGAENFRDSIARVYTQKRFALIDKTGQVISPLEVNDVDYFFEGLAAINIGGIVRYNLHSDSEDIDIGGKWGYIDRTGKIIIEPIFSSVKQFSDGLAAVKYKDKWGFINKEGKFVVEPQYDCVDSFSEGMAAVGYNNKSNVDITLEEWQNCENIDYRWTGQWGYINQGGSLIIKPQFYEANPFSGGIALVKYNNSKGQIANYNMMNYINKDGNFIWK